VDGEVIIKIEEGWLVGWVCKHIYSMDIGSDATDRIRDVRTEWTTLSIDPSIWIWWWVRLVRTRDRQEQHARTYEVNQLKQGRCTESKNKQR
jgi:hypothetical protein